MRQAVRRMAICMAFGMCLTAAVVEAKPFRFGISGDAATLDPHSLNVATTAQLLRQIYEPLVSRDKALALEPALAAKWSQVEPTRWRFTLRPGVVFQDGAPFTADDVVFSLKRVAAPSSNYANFVDTVVGAEKVDDLTVDVLTREPDPILVDKLTSVVILSKAWCEKNNTTVPQNAAQREESFSVRNANGTGPYMVKSREPDVRTVLVENPKWWGKREGNVTEYSFIPLTSPQTRVAALVSGEVDFLLDPPVQDVPRLKQDANLRVVEGAELRTMFLVMDQGRDELLYSNVKGKNPFKDKRVRQALNLAIDINAIRTQTMRGFAQPAAILFPPGTRGYAKDLDVRDPPDRAKAKALLTEAGYPDGFEVGFDCSNNRYVNDEAVCQAITAMWAQIGVKAKLLAQPLTLFFPKIQRKDTSLYFLGSGPPTLDAYYSLQIHLLTPTGRPGDGSWNLGGYTNPELDKIINQVRLELDPAKRDQEIRKAMEIYKAEAIHVPLYHQVIPWAMRKNIEAEFRGDNQLEIKWVTVK